MSVESIKKGKQPKEVIVLSDAVYHSYLGRYFLGQTEDITFGAGYNGWGALINPRESKVTMFLNAYTISNFALQPITVEGWLSSTFPGKPKVSTHVAAGNQSIMPAPMPQMKIESASGVLSLPKCGTYTFVRRVEPDLTLTKHDFQGMYIIPPGSSFGLYLLSPGKENVKARIAFGWWEDPIC